MDIKKVTIAYLIFQPLVSLQIEVVEYHQVVMHLVATRRNLKEKKQKKDENIWFYKNIKFDETLVSTLHNYVLFPNAESEQFE